MPQNIEVATVEDWMFKIRPRIELILHDGHAATVTARGGTGGGYHFEYFPDDADIMSITEGEHAGENRRVPRMNRAKSPGMLAVFNTIEVGRGAMTAQLEGLSLRIVDGVLRLPFINLEQGAYPEARLSATNLPRS